MRAYYHTWKHGGQEKTFVYHGALITVDAANAVMIVEYPELDSGRGLRTVVPFINTDEITIETCSPNASGVPGEPSFVPGCANPKHYAAK